MICPVCKGAMEPVIGAGTGPGLRYLWWVCQTDHITTAVVPVPDAGIPARKPERVL